MAKILIAFIRLYQLTLSKLLVLVFGPVCRFEPSCSRYAVACLQGHGVLRGSLLSVKRLCRCHPFNPGGFDPPPPPLKKAPLAKSPVSPPQGEAGMSVPSAGAPAPEGMHGRHE